MKKEELHIIAPTLSEISPKKIGFKIPNGYFNSVEDSVIAQIRSENIGVKNNAYKTPVNYFNEIEDIVLTKLKAESLTENTTNSVPDEYFNTIEDKVFKKLNSKPKVISINRISRYLAPIAIAASFLILFLINNNNSKITFDTLAAAEIEEFINNGEVDYDLETLSVVFPDVEINNVNSINSLSDSDVFEYLNESDLEEFIYEN
ncbi:hypothetical protein [Lutibacter citreus]|uniref:hypothetical protein n=1 Tax=Lutibacter citreus TaxID=2138210 RepID=UPI000DBEA923|nr:hypothetical protein [Lutibacter citreus]